MRPTLSSHLLVYHPLDAAALDALAAVGPRDLEVWLAEPHVPWRDPAAVERFRDALGGHGLRAASVHLPFYPSVPALREQGCKWSVIDPDPAARAEAVAGAAEGLRAAALLGADRGVLHLGWQRDPWDDHAHGWAREAVAALLPVAREVGVRLLLENIVSEGTRAAALVALLDEVDPDREAGVCLDLGHAHVLGGVLEELRAAAPRLDHLHVHDNDGTEDAHLAPGRGTIAWDAVLAELGARRFDGMGALELRDPTKGEAGAPAVCATAADEVRDFLTRLGEEATA